MLPASMWPACLVLLLLTHCSSAGLHRRLPDECYPLQVSVIVSSRNTNKIPRQLALSWENASPAPGDWIGLFDADPSSSTREPLHIVFPVAASGWDYTPFHETAPSSGDLGFTKKCLGYWAAYVTRDNATLVTSCLQTEPTWMTDLKTLLSPLQLRQIFLPGSHDSGSYKEYNEAEGEGLGFKYTITQEEDILSQLINGVRYLDIRVGYYPNTDEKWYLNHGLVRIYPLRDVLEDVQTFMEQSKEIVILDFHEFPSGFGSGLEIHKQLVEYVLEELGQYAASPALTWDATIGDLWAAGKSLIVSYNNNDMVASSDKLWPGVKHQWGNVRSLEDLYTYLSGVMKNPPSSGAWSAMAELTPNTLDIINDYFNGLRNMAEMVNQNVTSWYRGEWGKSVNIVAVDYFRGSDIVQAAIKWNKLRAQGITCL